MGNSWLEICAEPEDSFIVFSERFMACIFIVESSAKVEMARGLMSWGDLAQFGRLAPADIHGMRAARMKGAARRGGQRRGNLSLDRNTCAPAALHIGHKLGRATSRARVRLYAYISGSGDSLK